MPSVTLAIPDDFEGWRAAARALVMAGIPPEAVEWRAEGDPVPLFADGPPPAPPADAPPPRVPRGFPDLAGLVIRHRDPGRFALLHGLLHRLQHERGLLDDAADPAVARANAMARAVRRDAHKMHAFLRFREVRVKDGTLAAPLAAPDPVAVPDTPAPARNARSVALALRDLGPLEEPAEAPPPPPGRPAPAPAPESRFVAWFEPEHHILRAESGFFTRRFAMLRWSILTPELSAHWDGQEVRFGPGARRADAPAEDAAETLWRAYFASIFNPARLKPDAMRAEMPQKYWRNLPEAQDIPRLMQEAPKRVAEMVARGATPPTERRQRAIHLPAIIRPAQPEAPRGVDSAMPADLLTPDEDFAEAQAALRRDLLARNDLPPWVANATQPVMGEGPQHPLLMFIGEQPGDEEDLKGQPFVGPAGRLWNKALEEAGVPRGEAYVTNAVKHFKFTPTGKRRLHQSPDAGDITFYRPFLQREIGFVQPRLIVTLGATALRAVSGRAMPVTKVRSSLLRDPEGRPFYPTVHPSYLLRLPDPAAKAREYDRFVEDLGQAAATARNLPAR
ncbi:UdgX family uracil-DNA binding protein [Roseomonas populi]|uniref:Type-4 uracil-DNA glycosylase n=1 Tax=Roseomonas populi TaxID=3121582 RepID=A0ABT1X7A0_9PROT|nr:UdgX family uracil-DNA binding protein [Roseomonas pecuniae]MCR0983980.1 UdgX family uracil-DNA binding protein [Roseomonas pecuniae]